MTSVKSISRQLFHLLEKNDVHPSWVIRTTDILQWLGSVYYLCVDATGCNISNMRQCFITYQTQRRELKNTMRTRVFLTNFKVSDTVIKHCGKCLIYLLKQTDFEGKIKDAKNEEFFKRCPNTSRCMIFFVFGF